MSCFSLARWRMERDCARGIVDRSAPLAKRSSTLSSQRLYQWAWLDVASLAAHRDHAADDHAEQDVDQGSPDILPDGTQLPRMLTQPAAAAALSSVGSSGRELSAQSGRWARAARSSAIFCSRTDRLSGPLDSNDTRPRMAAPVETMTM